MIDDELPAATEQIGEAFLALGPIEDIVLLDLLPGQIAALLAQLIAQPREFLFPGEQFLRASIQSTLLSTL